MRVWVVPAHDAAVEPVPRLINEAQQAAHSSLPSAFCSNTTHTGDLLTCKVVEAFYQSPKSVGMQSKSHSFNNEVASILHMRLVTMSCADTRNTRFVSRIRM